MRLYLASHDLGEFAGRLSEMVGKNRRALVISNVKDYRAPEERKERVEKTLGVVASCGLEPKELDLRPYFGKQDELRRYVNEFNPGLVLAMGGNQWALATAMHLSGMDEILRNDLGDDKYVYGGFSAGAMVASSDLMNYYDSFGVRSRDKLEEAEAIYGEVYTNGLGIIPEYICPHADEEKYSNACKKAESDLRAKGLEPIVLNNADVVIVDGDSLEICRG